MDIDEYLKKKERRIAKRMVRLRDVSVFDFNYVPDSPLLREELKLVIDALVRYEKTGIANNILIVGSRGCGKTLSLRYLQELFRARGMTIHYANCRLTRQSCTGSAWHCIL
jgi:Cdc6-like AAA superfamily ATPase